MMRRLLIAAMMLAGMAGISMDAAYIVRKVSGDVTVTSGGNTVRLKEGMKVSPSDVIDIPADGKLDIFNELDNKIYTSVNTGKLSVIRLMLDAKHKAADNSGNVSELVSVSKSGGNPGHRLYMEKGMVKRRKVEAWQDSENVDVDPRTLARYVASVVYSGNLDSRVEFPVRISHANDSSGLSFRLENTVDFPVYFNLLKISGTEVPVIEVSELGQPDGCYVVLPGQSLSREQFSTTPADVRHVLVMSHCRYDVSEVIDMIDNLLKTEGIGILPEGEAPVYMIQL